MEWMMLPLKRYFEFSGRSRRMEFWMFALLTVILGLVASFIDRLLGYGTASTYAAQGTAGFQVQSRGPVNSLVSLALLIPTFSVAFRRLHDTDRSAWWLLLILVPVIGWIVLIVFYCLDGTPGPNRFGADPKGANLTDVFN